MVSGGDVTPEAEEEKKIWQQESWSERNVKMLHCVVDNEGKGHEPRNADDL